MKIAYVYDTIYPYTFGGIEKRIWELSTRLCQRGHEVHIFGPKLWDGPSIIQKEGIYLHGVCKPLTARFVEGRRSIIWPIYFSIRLLFPLVNVRFDIIDCQNSPYFPCYSVRIASIVKRSNMVITWHEVWRDYWHEYLGKRGVFGKFIEKDISSLKHTIIAVSHQTERDLDNMGVKKPIKVITNGIDLGNIRKIEPSIHASDIIFVGRLMKEKNIDILIRAIKFIKNKDSDIKAIIIGDGPEKDNIEMLIDNLSLRENILVLGRVEKDTQVYSYMKSSKVLVSPSMREGFGIVALEANACGLPVITLKYPRNAMCDLINENENGFICEPKEDALAEKILIAKSLSEHMHEKCLKSAESYDWERIAVEVAALYSEIVN